MRNGGQILVESLVALGAKKAFGVPGESYLAVLDAMHDTAGRFDYILCRNEGGASFMAAAYGKLTGQPGICMVTRGPGGIKRHDRCAYGHAGFHADAVICRPNRPIRS